jgi:hypothetical protein
MEIEQKSEIYPSNRGHKWTEAEESLLLEELNSGLSLDVIADFHSRTIRGIQSRCGEIAYKMYLKEIPMDQIVEQTKLDEESIKEWIGKKQDRNTKKSEKKEKDKEEKKESKDSDTVLESKDNDIRNDIKDIKKRLEDVMNLITDLRDSIQK